MKDRNKDGGRTGVLRSNQGPGVGNQRVTRRGDPAKAKTFGECTTQPPRTIHLGLFNGPHVWITQQDGDSNRNEHNQKGREDGDR
jgi:hypothetical protein